MQNKIIKTFCKTSMLIGVSFFAIHPSAQPASEGGEEPELWAADSKRPMYSEPNGQMGVPRSEIRKSVAAVNAYADTVKSQARAFPINMINAYAAGEAASKNKK